MSNTTPKAKDHSTEDHPTQRDNGAVPLEFLETLTTLAQWFGMRPSECWQIIKQDHPEDYACLTRQPPSPDESQAARRRLADAFFEREFEAYLAAISAS